MEPFLNKDVSLNYLISLQAKLLNLHLGLMLKKKKKSLSDSVSVIQFQRKIFFTSSLSAKLSCSKQIGFLDLKVAGLIHLLFKVI